MFADYNTDLNSILIKCDYLMTDYSGVVFDFLYLKRPIILYVPDYEEFLNKNGFSLNIVEKKISKIANNIDDLINLIETNANNNIEKEIMNNMSIIKREVFPKINKGIENIILKLKS
tara:strand:+ start:334 stop:684 length:351 start_codon:yes stop_codon:yes gene_type:complete